MTWEGRSRCTLRRAARTRAAVAIQKPAEVSPRAAVGRLAAVRAATGRPATVASREHLGAELGDRQRATARDGGVIRAKRREPAREFVTAEHATVGRAADRARGRGRMSAPLTLVAAVAEPATGLRCRPTARACDGRSAARTARGLGGVSRGTHHVSHLSGARRAGRIPGVESPAPGALKGPSRHTRGSNRAPGAEEPTRIKRRN